MTITKAFILNYIQQHPGCRRRDLPSWRANLVLISNILDDLIEDGLIEERVYNDPAQMENYLKYFPKTP